MSTPEEQQRQQQEQELYLQQQAQYQDQQPQQPQEQPDPYGTQTWQASTWDTSYQPVQSPLDGVPAQYPDPYAGPAAVWPEGAGAEGYRAEGYGAEGYGAEGFGAEGFGGGAPDHGAAPAYPQTAAPDHWFREEPPAAQQYTAQPQAPAAGQEWGEGAYAPSYPGPTDPPGQVRQTAAPDHWFREEPAAAPPHASQPQPQEWADSTAYLPPQSAADPAQAAVPAPAQAPAPEPGPPGEEPAYSPPTLAGNTLRAVDPAQARAEGRSPIIDPGPQAAILTAALGLVIAAAAALGKLALLAPLIALQGLTAAGWFRLNGMWPARQGIALAFAGAVVADVAVLAVDDAYGPGAIIGTLGAWVPLTLVLQLRSQADPDERMYGLMASVASAALAIVCAGYLAADSAAATVGAAAVAVAAFARALPLPTVPSVGVSLAAAAGAGIAVGGLTSVGAGGALIGLAAGVCALIGLRVAAYDYPSKFVHMTAGVALPLAAAAPAVYLIGRVVG
ncbi:hypothetical protein [Streptomyces sp. ISL-43]|uniref:hypothetical protein n=1 Tax=Streptomyces sp. ISL-43 TaxID=2819183 RepID=UPI0020361011|nr:hypothetical protein [Streptomyces sp. ISL-43]